MVVFAWYLFQHAELGFTFYDKVIIGGYKVILYSVCMLHYVLRGGGYDRTGA